MCFSQDRILDWKSRYTVGEPDERESLLSTLYPLPSTLYPQSTSGFDRRPTRLR